MTRHPHAFALVTTLTLTLGLTQLARAGANDPGPIAFDTQKHLADDAPQGAARVATVLGWLLDTDDGAGTPEWLEVASRFDLRAQMVETDPSFVARREWSFGRTAPELRLLATTIREVLAARPKASDPAKQKSYWVETGTLEPAKHSAFFEACRARIDKAAHEGPHPGQFGSSIVISEGATFAFEVYSVNREFAMRMAGIVRDVEREMGAHW